MRTLLRAPLPPKRALRLAGALCAGLLAAACSATGGAPSDAAPRSIAVGLYGVGSASFELVSEGHTRPVDLYSEERASASTKVQSDAIMAGLVDYLDDLGFDRYAHAGTAPRAGGQGAFAKVIEVREGDATHWWALTPAASREEIAAFGTAMKDFLELYNLTQGWQSVENAVGSDYFDKKKQASLER